jgi:polysaccharide biosynthesis/export protein
MPRVILSIARILLAGAACLAFAGCSTISGRGPSAGDVIGEASTGVAPRYEVLDIDPHVVETLRHRGPDSFLAHFGDYRPSVEPRIGIGDTIAVTIWEAGPGGLFSAPLVTDRFSTGSKSATIPDQVVGRDGAITVPYAGRVPVAGRTTRAVQNIVEHALQGKAIQPQVLVNVAHSVSNTVTVTGEVATGARVPLSVKGDRVMEVIAAAGGIRAPVNETYVQLSRGDVTARVAMTRVTSDPKENIYMRAGDVLTLIRDPQTFIAYGATGRNAEIPFDAEGINLSQALAKAGGLLDAQSDPAGVFVFRYEPEQIARALRPDSPLVQHGYSTPMVYRLNLHEANSLFLAQSFQVLNRDLLYVSSAPIADMRKVMEIVGLITGPAYTGFVASTFVK